MIKDLSTISHLRFTILGAAKSGLSCAKLLKKFNLNVFLSNNTKLSPETEKTLNNFNIIFEQNGHSVEKIIQNTDILIISPGILLSHDIVIKAKQNFIPVVSEVEIASWFFTKNIVCFAITGTNGKSTTTNYLTQLIESTYQKKNAIACGNIGKPLSEVLLEIYENNLTDNKIYLCVELSSYQLETIYSLNPLCTCFLNIQNDHLARYKNMLEYFKAKWRLILLTQKNGLTIIHQEVLKMAVHFGLSLPECKIIVVDNNTIQIPKKIAQKHIPKAIQKLFNQSISLPISNYNELNSLPMKNLIYENKIKYFNIHYHRENNSAEIVNEKNDVYYKIKNSCLPGEHNIFNILVANFMAKYAGITKKLILKQWEQKNSQYKQLEHRLEVVGIENKTFIDSHKIRKKITIINDSKATNVESTMVAIKSFNNSIRLLLGGEPKGDNYLDLLNVSNINQITIYPFGKAGPLIFQQLNQNIKNIKACSTNMLIAAKLALDESNDGDIILLSPACSSFDEFKDFEHRGRIFKQWATSCFEENIY